MSLNQIIEEEKRKKILLRKKIAGGGKPRPILSKKPILSSSSILPNIKITVPNSSPSKAALKLKTMRSEKGGSSLPGKFDLNNLPNIKITKTLSAEEIERNKRLSKSRGGAGLVVTSSIRSGDIRGPRGPRGPREGGYPSHRYEGDRGIGSHSISTSRLREEDEEQFAYVGHTKLSKPPVRHRFEEPYENGQGPALFDRSKQSPSFSSTRHGDNLQLFTGTRLNISNLDQGILEGDLLMIFKRVGEVKSIKINYDRAGRSNGTGHVIMARHRDAVDAMKLYQNANLDGKPLQLTMGTSLQEDVRKL